MRVTDSDISNVLLMDRELIVVQPKSDPVISPARIARASREVQYDAQQREDFRDRSLRGRQHKLHYHVNIAKAV
jgi:hypothetical protein